MTRRRQRRIHHRIRAIAEIVILALFLAIFYFALFGSAANTAVKEITYTDNHPTALAAVTSTRIEESPKRYNFSDEEVYLLAQLLCGDKSIDGDGEYDIDFKTTIKHSEVDKVLSVVMRRIDHDEFPDTVSDVVMMRNQFEVMPANATKEASEIAIFTVQSWCDAYNRYDNSVMTIPEDHLYFTGNGIVNTTSDTWR